VIDGEDLICAKHHHHRHRTVDGSDICPSELSFCEVVIHKRGYWSYAQKDQLSRHSGVASSECYAPNSSAVSAEPQESEFWSPVEIDQLTSNFAVSDFGYDPSASVVPRENDYFGFPESDQLKSRSFVTESFFDDVYWSPAEIDQLSLHSAISGFDHCSSSPPLVSFGPHESEYLTLAKSDQ
jgi:hypothetical protein